MHPYWDAMGYSFARQFVTRRIASARARAIESPRCGAHSGDPLSRIVSGVQRTPAVDSLIMRSAMQPHD